MSLFKVLRRIPLPDFFFNQMFYFYKYRRGFSILFPKYEKIDKTIYATSERERS